MHIFVNTKDIRKRVDELRERSHESKRTLAKIIRVSDSYACRLLKDRAEWNNEEYLRGTSKITNMTDGTDIDYQVLLTRVVEEMETLPIEKRNRSYGEAIIKMIIIMLGQEINTGLDAKDE